MQAFFVAAMVLLVCMGVLWWISVQKKDVSIIDAFWGIGFIIIVSVLVLRTDSLTSRQWLTIFMVGLWGLRLSAHIIWRSLGKPEDYRYQAFRNKDPKNFWWKSFYTVFLLQAGMMLFVSLPLFVIFRDQDTVLGYLDELAVLTWLIGFIFEAGGDWQLMRFRRHPENHGKILNTGLWAYTRHPNYFGDALVWWGFYLLACAVPGGYATILSPIFMTFMLLKVSGVGLLEKQLVNSKPGYQDYIKNTPAFLPLKFTVRE